MRAEKITFAACTSAMKSVGLSKEEMFPIDKFVIGGQEVAERVKDG
jgi:intracellular sulfur oxidation DsrE/DsrF family protein